MYCKNCGADEPEININNKSYCSSCGLPIVEPKAEEATILNNTQNLNEEKKDSEGGELNNAFSTMNSFMKDNNKSFYRSKDVRIVPRSIDGIAKKAEIPIAETPVMVSSEEEIPLEKPLQKEIEDLLSLSKEGEKKKPEAATIAEEPKEELSVQTKKELETKGNKEAIPLKEELKTQLEAVLVPKKEEKSEVEIPNNEETKVNIRVLKEEPQKETEPKLDKAIKKVDELGTASKLIDILEEDANKKEIEDKKKKVNSLGKSFSRLIDILNQPVESPKPVKRAEAIKDTAPDNITAILNSLNEVKEIESPLDTTEIEAPEEKEEPKEEEKELKPTVLEDETVPAIAKEEMDVKDDLEIAELAKEGAPKPEETVDVEDAKEEVEKPTVPKIPELEDLESEISTIISESNEPEKPEKKHEGLWPIFQDKKDEEKKDKEMASDTSSNDSFLEETAAEEENKNKEGEPFASEAIEEPKIHLSKKQKKEIENEIHSLGDKKGHVDHWPEEEVVNMAPIKNVETHALTSYMKSLVDHKREGKEMTKKEAEKKSKSGKIIIIALTIFITLVISASLLFFFMKKPDTKITEMEKSLTNLNFAFMTPSYLPPGYTSESVSKKDGNSAKIIYIYLPNHEDSLSLTQEVISNVDLEKLAEENSRSYSVKEIDKTNYYLLDDNKLLWTESGIQYILEKSGNLNQEELIKIGESI